MKIQAVLLFVSIFSSTFANAGWDGKIVNVLAMKEISRTELISTLSLANIVVMGEQHYNQKIQAEEGKIISEVVTLAKKENHFSTSWEFLNASSQEITLSLFNQLLNHEITTKDFLLTTQEYPGAVVYAPMIDQTALLGGQLFGINLSREEKAPVAKNGIQALDPKLLPPNFQLGGANYLERFTEIIKDHSTPEQITNYFAAQSLVDDVAAYHIHLDSEFDLKFLIIGAFHTQYNDGVIARIKDRKKDSQVVNVEIINASDYSANEIETIFWDQKYGARADYVLFVNEPKL